MRRQSLFIWLACMFAGMALVHCLQGPIGNAALVCVGPWDCEVTQVCSGGLCVVSDGKRPPTLDDDEPGRPPIVSEPVVLDAGPSGRFPDTPRLPPEAWGEPGRSSHGDLNPGRPPELRPREGVALPEPRPQPLPESDEDMEHAPKRCKAGETRACYPREIRGCSEQGGRFHCIEPCSTGKQACEGGLWGDCKGAITPKNDKQCIQSTGSNCSNPGPNGRCPP